MNVNDAGSVARISGWCYLYKSLPSHSCGLCSPTFLARLLSCLGIRGGAGNFGVVTGVTLRVHSVPSPLSALLPFVLRGEDGRVLPVCGGAERSKDGRRSICAVRDAICWAAASGIVAGDAAYAGFEDRSRIVIQCFSLGPNRDGSLRAWRHNTVHAQILDHLPIVVVSVSRDEGCDDRPRVQTVDTVNSGVGILRSNC